MQRVVEILAGHLDPLQKQHSPRPLGHTGLTVRMFVISRDWETSVALRRRQCWRFGFTHCRDLYETFVHVVETSWLTEVLRVVDRAETKVGKDIHLNLTVAQCHLRFQSEPSATAAQKNEENRLFDALMMDFNAANLRDFRNRQMFHLDLTEMLMPPSFTGNIDTITKRLIDWYTCVASTAFSGEPKYVTAGAPAAAKRAMKQFRQMMVAGVRRAKDRLGRWRTSHPKWEGI